MKRRAPARLVLKALGSLFSRQVNVATLYVRHTVMDYVKWRRAFDDHNAVRERYGISVNRVQHAAANPLEIIISLEAKDLARAREFVDSDDLRNAMLRAGVTGRPEIWYAVEIPKRETEQREASMSGPGRS
jgi:hypothetical protein